MTTDSAMADAGARQICWLLSLPGELKLHITDYVSDPASQEYSLADILPSSTGNEISTLCPVPAEP